MACANDDLPVVTADLDLLSPLMLMAEVGETAAIVALVGFPLLLIRRWVSPAE